MSPFVIVRLLLVALALSACVRVAEPASAEQGVRAFMAGVFDRPEAPLRVPSVAVVGDYALAGWIQSGHGGRTLLKRSAEGWDFVVCGGAELGTSGGLREAGLPADLVEPALARLAEAEAGLSKEDLGLLGDFKGMMKMQGVGHPARK
jgi:periplasmic copper chaperone A